MYKYKYVYRRFDQVSLWTVYTSDGLKGIRLNMVCKKNINILYNAKNVLVTDYINCVLSIWRQK